MDIVASEPSESPLPSDRAHGREVELPSQYSEYAMAVDLLDVWGLGERLRGLTLARRAGAYELVDVVLFLCCFLSATRRTASLVEFADSSAEHGHELAALAGRRRWLGQSSLSRALSAVDVDTARAVSATLLLGSSRAPAGSRLWEQTGYRDGAGEPLRVLHWDTTADTVRKRALPEGDDLPGAIRVSDELARPGYAGRKRGEGMFSRSVVSDATTGLWLHMDLVPGGGSTSEHLERAVQSTLEHLDGSKDEAARTVMVCDGASGGAPQAQAILNGGLHVLVRWADYAILKTDVMAAKLASARWLAVEDSRSGPRRTAIDIGSRVVKGRRVRIVAARTLVPPTRSEGRGAGHTIGAWHYELFLTSLPASRWAANDIVTLYYGRTAIENRFAAEDREFDLSRVFSYNVAGQLVASAIAMMLWNTRLVGGLCSVSQSAPARANRDRPASEGAEVHSRHAIEPMAPPVQELQADIVSQQPDDAAPSAHADAFETTSPDCGSDADDLPTEANDGNDHEARIVRAGTLICESRPGWSFDGQKVHCPQGNVLSPALRPCGDGWLARWRAGKRGCMTCTARERCTESTSAVFRKEVAVTLNGRDRRRLQPPVLGEAGNTRFEIAHDSPAVPPLVPDAPTLLPAVLRQKAVKQLRTARVFVIASLVDDDEVDHEHIADDAADRQRRRLTTAERIARNERPDDARARVRMTASRECAAMVSGLRAAVRSA